MGKLTTIGIPPGGSTGEVLKKKTGTNYDVEWGTGGGGGSGTVTSIGTTSPITGGTITTTGTIGITQATTSTDGYLSATDWNTFNGKQNALTNPVTGTGTTNQLSYFTGASTIASLSTATYPSLTELSYVKGVTSAIQTQLDGKATGTGTSGYVTYWTGTNSVSGESNLFWDAANDRLGIGISTPTQPIDVIFNNSSASATGTKFKNTNSAGRTTFNFLNDNNKGGIFGTYGTTFPASQYRSNFVVGATDILIFLSDCDLFNGGISPIDFTAGGYGNNPTLRITPGSTGNVLIGTTTNSGFKLDVNGLANFTGTSASDGGQLGSELLSTSGWTSTGWTGSFGAGWTHTVGNTTALTNTLAAGNGNYYQITYTVTGRTAGTFSIAFGGVTTSGLSATGAVGPRATSTGTLSITPTTDFDGTIVISIKTITQGSATITIKNSGGTVISEIGGSASDSNIFIGLDAGSRNTTGIQNTFIGAVAGNQNTTGINNSFFGRLAGSNNTSGTANSFFGHVAGYNVVGGFNNSIFGASAGYASTGTNNSFFGLQSGYNTSGNNNSFFGRDSGFNNSTGAANTFIGLGAGQGNTTGSNNSALGMYAGLYAGSGTTANQTSNNSIYVGYQSRSSASGNTNEVVIGYDVVGNGSNTTTIGNSSTTDNYLYGNFNITDAKNIILGTTTGTKIGTSTSQKIGFFNASPVSQRTTAGGAATLVGGGGTTITDTDTFDGYTLKQIVKALRDLGLLA